MKVGQKSSDSRLPKPPKPPEKPLMPYMRYSRKVWESVKNANGQLKLWEVGKIIGQMWRELPENEKSHFVEEYENDKLQYNDALRLYHNSPAYKSWLLHKEKVEKSMDDNESIDSFSQSQSFKQKDRIQKDQQTVETRESYILEDNDEDPEEVFTAKHVAAQRFQRNHKLMLDLFSDFKIPELGIVVTEVRLNALKQQVNGLITHKRKLDDEMSESERIHENKKLKIKTESERFWNVYNKELEARPIITEKMFSDMVKKARDEIIREEKEREEFIKARLNTNDKMISINEAPVENNLKQEPVNLDEITKIEQTIENCISQNSIAPPPISLPPTINKTPSSDSQIFPGPNESLEQNSNVPGPPYGHMSNRSQANYESRSAAAAGYNFGQSSLPPNPSPNFQSRYPHPTPPTLPLAKPNMHSGSSSHALSDQEQKYLKSAKSIDHMAPNIEKEMAPDIKNKNFKEFSDLQFPPPKISESSPCPSNVSNNSKAPILSPECEPESKASYYDTNESSVSMQSPIKKVTNKKRKPPSKSKSVTGSQPAEIDNMNSTPIPPDLIGNSPMVNPHISPSKISNTAMDPSYQSDPNFSQLPLQQGMYPYHYYPPQFVPHSRTPGPYGTSYNQPGGYNQANYYNQMPQTYRAMAPHSVQTEGGVNQYGIQHKPMQHNQAAYPVHPYGPGPYTGYGSQFAPTNQSFPNQPVQDSLQIHTSKDQNLPTQPNSIPSQMNMVEDSTKYQSEMSAQTNQGFGNTQIGGPMPPPGYSSQYPGMPYISAPPVPTGNHYPGVQGHFYYPPGPQSHSTPGQTPPDHPFWSHQQSSNYSSMQSLVENNSSESQPPKIQE